MQVTLHHEEDNDVRINSLLDEDAWFNSRVKCFPLYSLMLAVNRTTVDLLSLGGQGQELKVLAPKTTQTKTQKKSHVYRTLCLDSRNASVSPSDDQYHLRQPAGHVPTR